MKKIYVFFVASILLLSFSIPSQVKAQEFPLIMSGYTEEGIYFEVHGETFSARYSDRQYVLRYVTYSGKITPQMQMPWEESIDGVKYTGTLNLRDTVYSKKDNITTATYEGYLTVK